MKIITIILGALMLTYGSYAQNQVDVLRYSRTSVGGTARAIGYGGATASLGADFSTLSINPAGIGLYKKSEISISPTFYGSNVESKMGEYTSKGFKDNFNLNGFGLVTVKDLGAEKGWKYLQFGVGVNRTNNFNHNYHITNENRETSLITDYQNQAYGYHPDDLDAFSTAMAWNTFLLWDTIRDDAGYLEYTSHLARGGAYQEMKTTTWGSMNELVFSLGSSFNDIFYVGGTVGFPFVRYFEEYEYMESDVADTIRGFDKFFHNQSLETSGTGVNFKMGFIVRPTGFLRFAIAYHSPTYINLADEYSAEMESYWDDGSVERDESPEGYYEYSITTPMKVIGSATFSLARLLLVSADVEYVNYSSGRLSAGDYDFSHENGEVRDMYKPTANFKGGAEIRLRPISFRAGVGYFGSPYADEINDGQQWQVSAGVGYRTRDFFMDFGYSYTVKSEDYYLYDPALIDPATLTYNVHRLAISAGYKF